MKGVLSAVFSLVMAVALCVSYTFAQTDTPRVIKGGVLNGKAVSLPKPEYPESARAAKIEGIVSVKVLIDEEGNVISAEPVGSSSTRASAAVAFLAPSVWVAECSVTPWRRISSYRLCSASSSASNLARRSGR